MVVHHLLINEHSHISTSINNVNHVIKLIIINYQDVFINQLQIVNLILFILSISDFFIIFKTPLIISSNFQFHSNINRSNYLWYLYLWSFILTNFDSLLSPLLCRLNFSSFLKKTKINKILILIFNLNISFVSHYKVIFIKWIHYLIYLIFISVHIFLRYLWNLLQLKISAAHDPLFFMTSLFSYE